jgi:hypothetical protein
MSERPESFEQCFRKPINLFVGSISANHKRSGRFNFFRKRRKVVLHLTNIVGYTQLASDAWADVDPAEFDEFVRLPRALENGANHAVRIAVLDWTSGNTENKWVHLIPLK